MKKASPCTIIVFITLSFIQIIAPSYVLFPQKLSTCAFPHLYMVKFETASGSPHVLELIIKLENVSRAPENFPNQ